MNKTIEYYNQHAQEFCEATVNADMSFCRNKFLSYIPKGGRILDAGCGSGRDSRAFGLGGYKVEAFDASEAVCEYAKAYTGLPVRCCGFDDISGEYRYDGIWACASLLHLKPEALDDVLEKLYTALRAGGILYASFKEGSFACYRNGRFFCDFTKNTLKIILDRRSLFYPLEYFITTDVRQDRKNERWINVIAKKMPSVR